MGKPNKKASSKRDGDKENTAPEYVLPLPRHTRI